MSDIDPLYQIGNTRQAEDIRRRRLTLRQDRRQLARLMSALENNARQLHRHAHTGKGKTGQEPLQLRDLFGRTMPEIQRAIRFEEKILQRLLGHPV